MTYKIMVESAEGVVFCATSGVKEDDLDEEFNYVTEQYEDNRDVWTEKE